MIDAGALGFKSFMSPSGINDFVNVVKNDIKLVLPWLMRNAVPYLLHCELVGPVSGCAAARLLVVAHMRLLLLRLLLRLLVWSGLYVLLMIGTIPSPCSVTCGPDLHAGCHQSGAKQ